MFVPPLSTWHGGVSNLENALAATVLTQGVLVRILAALLDLGRLPGPRERYTFPANIVRIKKK